MARRFNSIHLMVGLAACVLLGQLFALPTQAQDTAPDGQTCATDARIVTATIQYARIDPASKFPLVLSQTSPGGPPWIPTPQGGAIQLTENSPDWADWRGEPPSPELIHAWFADTDASVARCWANGQLGAPLPMLSAADEAREAPGLLTGDKIIVHISLPLFNADKTRALVYVGTTCSGLCGFLSFFTLRKNGDDWTVVGERLVRIS